MSQFLERLRFFEKPVDTFSGDHGVVTNEDRTWEESYRNRWRHDKVVRSTHGVNCTGGCSWNIHVKNGLVAFEMQATDYPRTRPDMPNHEPRGCQRGASFSWYLYSPQRVKYPLMRGRLLELYRAEKALGKDPVEAWAAIQEDKDKRKKYTAVRGLGGFVRGDWEEVTEVIAAANVYTIGKYGPDRVAGFSPIPAMSMISYAAGSRYLSLIGGVPLSFYDWYCDLPPASPQVWGEQTDVPESADWYNSSYIIICGANLPMTRTPDAHFATEARYNGTKIVSMAPDYAEFCKFADLWMPVKQGTDSAVFMAMGHVVLKEFFIDQQVEYFEDYTRQFTDMPIQVILEEREDGQYVSGRYLRASDFNNGLDEENNPEWKTIVYDENTDCFTVPNGSIGFRWGEKGRWNLLEKNAADQTDIKPQLTALSANVKPCDDVVNVAFPYFGNGEQDIIEHKVPVRKIESNGKTLILATVFDLQLAQYAIDRSELDARMQDENCATSYDDASVVNTPAWQEKVTGVKAADVIRTGREFAQNAKDTQGRSMVILGAAPNHWYHNDMNYRSIMNLLHMCGCVGQSGGGWAHYVGQEKLRPQAGWAPVAFALDWHRPCRQMNGTTFFYFHTDQWRYERVSAESLLAATADKEKYKDYQLADYNVKSQRLGWLPSAPHFNKNPLVIAKEAKAAGAETEADISDYVAKQLKSGELAFAAEDIDAEENHPRNLFVWRANLIGSSAKGHEYFLKHLLGAQNGVLSEGVEGAASKEIKWREDAPIGKLDLMVDINFRLNSTGAYSDIVLPTATWYEKNDLNTTDMHPFIHPLSQAVDPGWESRSDWQIFRTISKKFAELSAKHLGTQTDLLAQPMMHDTPGELAQPFGVEDWKDEGVEAIPGKNMPVFKTVERDFSQVGHKFEALGPLLETLGNNVKGIDWDTKDEYEHLKKYNGVIKAEGITKGMPSLEEDKFVCDTILSLAPETNGEVAHKSWKDLGKRTGIDHNHLCDSRKDEHITYHDIQAQPRKIITAPTWSGIESEEVSYTSCYTNIHEKIPFRTITGRAQFYQDHEWMLDFGEGFASYRPQLDMKSHDKIPEHVAKKPHLTLAWITPHSKWGIHSTYQDTLRMLQLFRGGPVVWISESDAKKAEISDNDWVEAINVNGATVARAVVSQRIPDGVAMMYHAQEKIINVPGSPTTGKRGGILNSVTRITVKPTHMIGGYAQLAYGFNYYGTVGSQRDEMVIMHKIADKDVEWLEGDLTPEREAQLNPPGINN